MFGTIDGQTFLPEFLVVVGTGNISFCIVNYYAIFSHINLHKIVFHEDRIKPYKLVENGKLEVISGNVEVMI